MSVPDLSVPDPPHPDIVIGIPNNGEMVIEVAMSLIGAVLKDTRGLIADVGHCSGPFLDQNRNEIIFSFLNETNASWLLFVDTDIALNIDDIYTLYDIAVDNNLPLLGGIYFFSRGHRKIDFIPVVHKADAHGNNIYAEADYIDYKADYFEVDDLGTGAMLISRKVLEAVTRLDGNDKPYWIKTYDENGTFTRGEDVYFCEQVRKAGFSCYATGRVTPRHFKTLSVGLDFFYEEV